MKYFTKLCVFIVTTMSIAVFAQTPYGNEFRVNTYTTLAQSNSSISGDAQGNFVVAWESRKDQGGSTFGIYFQRYDNLGNTIGTETVANTELSDNQINPSVAMDSLGNFVVVWQSFNQDGSEWGVYGQRFNSSGTAVGEEFLVADSINLNQENPAVAMNSNGQFVVVWETTHADTADSVHYAVWGQRYDATGNRQGINFRIDSNLNATINGRPENIYRWPKVAMAQDGSFVVVYQTWDIDGELGGIYGQRFSSTGTSIGGEFEINSSTSSSQRFPDIGMDYAGNFIVTWSSYHETEQGIYAQRYDSFGDEVNGEFHVNEVVEDQQEYSRVAMDRNGNFTIAWQSANQDTSGYAVIAKRYAANGDSLGSEFRVNTYQSMDQVHPAVHTHPDLGLVIAWESWMQDGDLYGIYAQMYKSGPVFSDLPQIDIDEDQIYRAHISTLYPYVNDEDNSDTDLSWQFFDGTNLSTLFQNDSLIITPDSQWAGIDSFMVIVSDPSSLADTTYQVVAVAAIDDPPVVVNPIDDVDVLEDAVNTVIDLSAVFSDVDNDDLAITKSLFSNDNTTLVTASIVGNTLTLDYQPNQSGIANITVRGTSNGLTVDDSFVVTVTAQDDPPTVANQIPDVNVLEDAENTIILLDTVFTDVDNDDASITKSVFNNDNTTLVTASIVGNTLTLDYQPNQNGIANITIRGTSNGLTVDDVFVVNVTAQDDPPTVANPILDVDVLEDAVNSTIDLTDVFTDIDNDDAAITKSVFSNDNTALVVTSIVGNTLTLDYQPNQSGTANITIRGTSNGQTIDDAFVVTVTAQDDPPTVANPILDVDVLEDAVNSTIDLTDVFTDIDNDDAAITKSVFSNDNTALVSASIVSGDLILDYQENQSGTANITIRGTSNGQTVDDAFVVTVTAVDDAPTVATPISDVAVSEDAPNTTINLGSVFTDVDNDDAAITKDVFNNDNPNLVTASIDGNTLTLDYQPNQSGTANITIRGTSNGLTVDDIFVVTVGSINDPPTVANPITDVDALEDAVNSTIDLTAVFTDIDDDDGLITKEVLSNSNTSLVDASIAGNTLTLDYQLNQFGTATITIRGTSNGQFVDDVFEVSVTAVDDAPFVANPITDVDVLEDASNSTIELSAVFSDVDNDDAAITKSVFSNDNTVLVAASIVGNTLTLDYQPDQSGTANIIIRGTSNGLTVDDTFIVTVSAQNDPPTVANPITDVDVLEDAVDVTINLIDVFTDLDNDDAAIIKTVFSNTDTTLVNASIEANTLTLDFQDDQNGSATITIRGTSGGQTVDDVFDVNVAAVNDAPVITDQIAINTSEETTIEISLSQLIVTDVDNIYPTDFNLTVMDGQNYLRTDALITPVQDFNGDLLVPVRIYDGVDSSNTFNLTVVVSPINDPPVLSAPEAISFNEDDSVTYLITEIYDWVEDADNPDTSLVFTTNDGNHVTAMLDSPLVVIKAYPNWFGVDTVMIMASDGQLTDTAEVVVTVHSVNDLPMFSSVPDSIKMLNTEQREIVTSAWVSDDDLPNDNLDWVFEVTNDNIDISFDQGSSTLTISAPEFIGFAMLRFTVTDDSSASASDSLVISVEADPLSIEDLNTLIPKTHELYQNYPNPFNPLTNIKFGLPKTGMVTIQIFNILGQKVDTILDEVMSAGYHTVNFNASHLSSGVYFYMIRTRDFYQVKKMVLMK